jgi:DNA-binding NarL/FixJ family response regulator
MSLPAAQEVVRVLIVDDQQLMRDGIESLLKLQDGILVVGTAANGQDAIDQAASLSPDVILMDVRMPVLDGVEATREIRRQAPSCKIMMLTTFNDDAYVVQALEAGASGYLLKDLPAGDLAQAIRAVHRDIYQLDPTVVERMRTLLAQAEQSSHGTARIISSAEHSASGSGTAKVSDLSDRELEVLRLIARGATNREIAEALVISEGTVKNHISNILSRLGVRDRTQAAIYARDHALL